MAKVVLTEDQKKARKAVRRFNAYLNLKAMARTYKQADWNEFIRLLKAGHLFFAGGPTGFHIDTGVAGGVVNCHVRPKDVKRAHRS